MTTFPNYAVGTVAVTNGGTTVVGTGTVWSGVNARPGDLLQIGSVGIFVSDVTDTTHLVIPPYAGITASGLSYTLWQVSPLRYAGGQAMADVSALIATLNATGMIFFVAAGGTPDNSLGANSQYATDQSTGAWWKKIAGVWTSTSPPVSGYGGTSTTSLTIANSTTKVFATQANLAYNGARVRAASASGPPNYMEGVCTYAGTTLTMTVDAIGGSGTKSDWVFSIAGQPNITGLQSANNLSDVASKVAAMDTLSVHGADIAAAATLNLDTATGNFVHVTGNTGITAITLTDGRQRTVFFTGTPLLTNGASLVLPGGKDVQVAAGDIALFVADGTTVRCTDYLPATRSQGRVLIDAAPMDAQAYNGMQVNGNCDSDQANAGGAVTLTATGSLVSTQLIDGMLAHVRGSYVATAQQVAAPSGMPATKALKITVGTAEASIGANDELSIVLPIEGYHTSRLFMGNASFGSPQSLGFWIQGHRTGTYSGSIRNGGKTRSYPFTFTIAAADTPQWVSLSGASSIAAITDGSIWAADNTVGQYVTICLAAGTSRVGPVAAWASADFSGATGTTNGVGATSDIFYISGVISLPGIELPPSTRAPYIMRPYDEELRRCQRYYYAMPAAAYGYPSPSTGGFAAIIRYDFKVSMRAIPTVTTTYSSTTNVSGSPSGVSRTVDFFTDQVVSASSTNTSWTLSAKVDARLA